MYHANRNTTISTTYDVTLIIMVPPSSSSAPPLCASFYVNILTLFSYEPPRLIQTHD